MIGKSEDEAEPYEMTMTDDSVFYMYKQDKRRIIFRTKSETRDQHDVMGVLILAASGMTYRPLKELESMVAAGAAELIGENCQYKYFREVVK